MGSGGTILTTSNGGETWRQLEDYRRGPAPWAWLVWLGAFACLLAGARELPAEPEQQPESVADRLASDRPLGPGDPDPLGYQRIAAGLSRFLRNEKTEPPLSVAITGEWGSGKSSLMNMLRGDLERYGFRPVWFNAWHHQKEEHLFAALLGAVRDQAVPGWWSIPGLLFRGRLFRKRTRAHVVWAILLLTVLGVSLGATVVKWPQISAQLFAWWSAFPTEIATEGGAGDGTETGPDSWLGVLATELKTLFPIFGLLSALVGLWAAIRNRLASWQLSPAKLMASLGERVQIKQLDVQLGFRHRFADAFREVCEALGPRPLVIIIDDLDRCRPEQVVETLEAVNFLVTAGPCYVVLGVAPEQVMRCVGLGFKDIAAEMADGAPAEDGGRAWRREFARNYLEKLLNVEVPVPILEPEDARRMIAPADEAQPRQGRQGGARAALLGGALAGVFVGALYLGGNFDRWFQPVVPEPVEVAGPQSDVTQPATEQRPATEVGGDIAGPVQPVGETTSVFFRPGREAQTPWWSWQLPLLMLGLLGGLALAIHVLRPQDPTVRDSPEFVRALDIWVPVVLSRTRSPRAVKRFVNRVRYYAMCEAPPEPTPGLAERIKGMVRCGAKEERATRLPETLLVALAAIQQWRPEILSNYESLNVEQLFWDFPAGSIDDTFTSALQQHGEAFGGFSPRSSELERFRSVAAGVTVR